MSENLIFAHFSFTSPKKAYNGTYHFLKWQFYEKSFIHQQEEISFVKTPLPSILKDKIGSGLKYKVPFWARVGDGMQTTCQGLNTLFLSKSVDSWAHPELVPSLAKWKRTPWLWTVSNEGEGLFVHMKALRPDRTRLIPSILSMWTNRTGKRSFKCRRDLGYLEKKQSSKIYKAIRLTELAVEARYDIDSVLPNRLPFTSIQRNSSGAIWPDSEKNVKMRFTKRIWDSLSGWYRWWAAWMEAHDGRAPDYDDWTSPSENGYKGLNGDIPGLEWATVGEAFNSPPWEFV